MGGSLPFQLPALPVSVRVVSIAALLGVVPELGHRGEPAPPEAQPPLIVTVAGAHIDVGPDGAVHLEALAEP